MLPSWATETVTVVEPAWVTDRNTQVADYDHPASVVAVAGCSVQPGASAETLAGRQAVVARWTVFMPEGTAPSPQAQVIVRGVRYAVDGQPAVWDSPTGALSHVVVLLIDWEG